MIEITDTNFELEVIQSVIPVVVDFYAEWCNPCLQIASILEELELENNNSYRIGKYNVDENKDYAIEWGVRGIPTILFFVDGELVERLVGVMSKTELVEKIQEKIS
jgi:thioredoxin 1